MQDNFEKFKKLREDYPNFIYENFAITNSEEAITIKFKFVIENLTTFEPEVKY